ncbi:GNAT family N-acetyltransferase [Microbacterium amylolyticum]|uniref:GNAT superfamily N-acetyltransferase n=1 Tax=Microbacterium amylolyticum TaxID=936337 RepID=A0ABS4ZFB2_9MICO|nr:GNAT family N-acetyltransferase [Microbacterium amylolyticum]MBP2435967.1 GNAT superfamily N-acetyltransferase [Microbacterium amylolyticum]
MTHFPVRGATTSDLRACAALIGQELRDDDMVRALIPGEEDRERRIAQVHLALLHHTLLTGGAVDVVCGADGGVRAVAMWQPAYPLEASTIDRAVLRSRIAVAIGRKHRAEAEAADAYFASQRPEFPHWYLDTIVVSRHAQGEGNGTHLLQYRLRQINAEGLPVYLEATSNGSRRLYERFGFEPWGKGEELGYGATAMLRHPAR